MQKELEALQVIPKTPVQTSSFEAGLASTATFMPNTPCQSKLLTTQTHHNPLMAAAAPLLALIGKLDQLHLADLYDLLSHEVKAFTYRSTLLGYSTEHMMVARYLLCSILDEELLTLHEKTAGQLPYQTLLAKFHDDDSGDEGFFLILQRLLLDPKTHLDLLELCYIGLSQNFLGKFKHATENAKKVQIILSQLYYTINRYREEPPRALSTYAPAKNALLPAKQSSYFSLKSTGMAVALVACLYTGFHFALVALSEPLYHAIAQVV